MLSLTVCYPILGGPICRFKAQHGIVPWPKERLSNEIGTPRFYSAATSTVLHQNDALEAVVVARPSDIFQERKPDLYFGSKLFVLEVLGLKELQTSLPHVEATT